CIGRIYLARLERLSLVHMNSDTGPEKPFRRSSGDPAAHVSRSMKMKAFILMVAMVASSAAYADGFKCETLAGDLAIKAYNNTQPSEGTRTGAVMVLSDPAVNSGRKTIARFTDVNGVLTSQGA